MVIVSHYHGHQPTRGDHGHSLYQRIHAANTWIENIHISKGPFHILQLPSLLLVCSDLTSSFMAVLRKTSLMLFRNDRKSVSTRVLLTIPGILLLILPELAAPGRCEAPPPGLFLRIMGDYTVDDGTITCSLWVWIGGGVRQPI